MSVHLSTKFRHQVTWNGYAADLMKSGLQKYIRRGQTDKALYCAGELDLFKEAQDEEKGEGVRTNFLHRLMVIYMEDVENVSLFPTIYHSMKELFTERTKPDRNKQKEERQISEVVRLLAASQKARMCSHIRAVFNPIYKAIHASYPSIHHLWTFIEKNNATTLADYCKLFQTYLQEKNVLAVYYAFQIDQSTEKLTAPLFRSKSPVWFIFHELVKRDEQVKLFVEWYKEHLGTIKESFLCWLFPLLHVLDIIPKGEVPAVQEGGNWDRNRAGEKIVIDDYVEDKHTSKGRGKGLVEFALRGSLVENQAGFVIPLWKQFYEDGKRMEDGVPILGQVPVVAPAVVPASVPAVQKPSAQKARRPPIVEETLLESSYPFLVRTQLVTMGSKMDVYLAKNPAGKLVVVKGPYQTRDEIDVLLSNTEWKKRHGLPYNHFEVKEMIPDRWPEGTPLGARNKIDRSRTAFFLIFDSYLQENEIRTKMHSSSLWPATEVVDWDQIPFHFDYKSRALTDQEYRDYVHAVLFRYLLGISDFADRNFLMKDGRVISIDEDIENREIDLYKALQKNKAEFVYRWLLTHYDDLQVRGWQVKYPSQQAKLEEIQDRDRCLRLFQPAHVSAPVAVAVVPVVAEVAPVEVAPVTSLVAGKASFAVASTAGAAGGLEVAGKASLEPPQEIKDRIKPEITISKMNDNFVFIDNLYRSRMTLLDILEERGYEVAKYRAFSPAEATAAAAAFPSLSFKVTKRDDPTKVCDIRYAAITRQKLEDFFKDVEDEDSENTEVIVMMPGPVGDAHHMTALKQYMLGKEQPGPNGEKIRRKLRVSFFSMYMLVVNPLKHTLVPKHELVPEEKHKELMASLYATSKTKFPEIKFHVDPIARCIGAVPGDIVKITRASASSGESIIYRVCAP